jgi:hypothetical protein
MNAFVTQNTTHFRDADHVINAYCRLSSISRATLCDGVDTTPLITRHRHYCWFIMRDLTLMSHARIGSYFGGRDHSTIWNGIAGVADMITANPERREYLAKIHKAIADMPVDVTDPETDQALALARRLLITAQPSTEDVRQLAACMISLAVVIRSPELNNLESRAAAIRTLQKAGGALHG